jgi:hypothetical protein
MKPSTNSLSQTILKGTRKTAIMMALFLTVCVSYSFAKPVDSINGEISIAFKKNFRNAQIMKTEARKGFTKLTFKLNEVVMFAFYSDNGQLLAVTRNIVSSQLPMSLMMSLKNEYDGYWITELFEFTGDSENCYYASLENEDVKITLRSNGDTWELYTSAKK